MDGDEPGGDEIYEVVEEISVCDAVGGGIEGEEEEEEAGNIADTCSFVSIDKLKWKLRFY